jgi:hypothetical protein
MKTGCVKEQLTLAEAKAEVARLSKTARDCFWNWVFCYECEAFHVYRKKKY